MSQYPEEDLLRLSPEDAAALLKDSEAHALLSCPSESIAHAKRMCWDDIETTADWLEIYATAVALHLGRDLPPPIPSIPSILPFSPEAQQAEIEWQRGRLQHYLSKQGTQ